MNIENSIKAFNNAKQLFPGGVNSPVRAFKAVGGTPLFIKRAKGAYLYDEDDNQYIDFVLSWGPMILGHANDDVLKAVEKSLYDGTSYGAPSVKETRLAKLLQERLPILEKMRFVSSGTEATMSAVRLARGITGKDKIVKFIGNYHGHSDSFLVQAGSGVATFSLPNSPGVTQATAKDTLAVPYNDIEALENLFKKEGDNIACVIVEAVAGNMGLVKGDIQFITTIRDLTKKYKALFIMDEVMSGFRSSYIGALGVYPVQPDLITLGKVVGGGFPVAVFGGKKEYMDHIAPIGNVYQAGTLSGNPIAMVAGYETVKRLTPELFSNMEQLLSDFCNRLRLLAEQYQVPLQVVQVGTMFSFFFNDEPVKNFDESSKSDQQLFAKVHHELLKKGIYFAPSQYESNFISASHTKEDMDKTLQAFEDIFKGI